MPKGTTKTTIKTAREVTDSELLHALKNSMSPIFEDFEEQIKKSGGKVLHIEVQAKAGNVKLSYGFTDIETGNSVFSPTNVQAMASADEKTTPKETTL